MITFLFLVTQDHQFSGQAEPIKKNKNSEMIKDKQSIYQEVLVLEIISV
jgi:hypothetical protein